MSKGKIVKRVGEKAWDNPKSGKKVYFTSIELDNGDKGEVWCDNSGELKEGEEIDYDLIPREGKSNTIKLKRGGAFGGGFKGGSSQKEDVELKVVSFAFAYSKDLCVAGKIDIGKLPDIADVLANKMLSLYKKIKQPSND